MSYLSVEDSFAVDPILVDEGAGIFAVVMEDLDNGLIFEYLLESLGEGVVLEEVKHIARATEANLRRLSRTNYLNQ